jgi:chloramphenicol 3-O-phosphotransferase
MGHDRPIPALVITGPVGAGKSTVAAALSALLEERGVRHAMIDQDHLRWIVPSPPGDAFAAAFGYRNLAAIWPNYRAAGIDCLILADVVEDRPQVAEYERAMPGTAVTIVRLDVPMPLILSRLEGRESAATIAWYRNRAPELQGIMERHGVADLVIDVGERTPDEVALEIAMRIGLVPAAGCQHEAPSC